MPEDRQLLYNEKEDAMRESFYEFMRQQRDPNHKDDLTQLAYDIASDGMFPKTSTNYDQISRYLETEVDYVSTMTLFDEAWDLYEKRKKTI